MPPAVASNTDLGVAMVATGSLAPCVTVGIDICRANPFPASPRGAIKSVSNRVFHILLVPHLLELGIEKRVDIFQANGLRGAAARGHLLRICHGLLEPSPEAVVAHAMAAVKLGTPRYRNFVQTSFTITTGDTIC
jgi:hypothetical protein